MGRVAVRALFPYPLTSLLGCCLGSFVGCLAFGLPFSEFGRLVMLFAFPFGLAFAAPVNFVFLPLVWLRVPQIPSKPAWVLGVGCVGGFFSPSLVMQLAALGERLIKKNPILRLEWRLAVLPGLVGAVAGTACAIFFLWSMRRRDAARRLPQA